MKQRIRLTEGQLHKIIKESVRNVLREGADFYDFNEILERNGWGYHNFYDVTRKTDGRTGTRYELSKNSFRGEKPVPFETLKDELIQTFGEGTYFADGTHRYAPELNSHSVVIWDDAWDD